MIPPWLRFPHIPRGSIGWRMGDGQGYYMEFCPWYRALASDDGRAYRERYPEPAGWNGFYDLLDEDR